MPNSEEKDKAQKPVKKSTAGLKGYAKYSGVAFQMIIILLLFVYAGKWLDEHFATETPYFTLVLVLIGLALALYIPLRGLMR